MVRPVVEIEGGQELRQQFADLAAELGDAAPALQELLRYAAEPVADEAERRVPVDTGALKASLRVTGGKATAFVRAGYAATYYARFVHDGTRYMIPRPFLDDAADYKRPEVVERFDRALAELVDRSIR